MSTGATKKSLLSHQVLMLAGIRQAAAFSFGVLYTKFGNRHKHKKRDFSPRGGRFFMQQQIINA